MPTTFCLRHRTILAMACVFLGASMTGCDDGPDATTVGSAGATGGGSPSAVVPCDTTSKAIWDPNLDRSPELVSGPVQAIGSSHVQVMGFSLAWDACTGFFEVLSSFADPQPMSSENLAVGDSTEIPIGSWAPIIGNGRAHRITRRPADDLVEIRGWYVESADRESSTIAVHGNVFKIDEQTRFFSGHQNFGDGPEGCSCEPSNLGAFWKEVNSVEYVIFGVVEVKGRPEAADDGNASRLVATDIYWYYI